MFGIETEKSTSKRRKRPRVGYVIVTSPLRYWTINLGQTEDIAKAKVYFQEAKATKVLNEVLKKYPQARIDHVTVTTGHEGNLIINGHPSVPQTTEKAMRKLVYDKYGGHCAYCGVLIPPGESVMDRYYPNKGDGYENLMPCCHACYRIKGGKTPREFQDYIEARRAKAQKGEDYRYAKKFGLIVDSMRLVFYYLRPEGRAQFEANLRRKQEQND